MGKVQMILHSSEFEEEKSHCLVKKIYWKYYTLFIDKVFYS